MSVWANLALISVSIGSLLMVMAIVRRAGQHWQLSAELQRKCVHLATGLYALTLPLTFSETWPVLLLIAVSMVVMLVLRLPRFASNGLSSALHGVARKSYGELFLALSTGFLFFSAKGDLVLYVLPITILTLSDAAAAMTGTRYGRKHFAVEAGTKSWEGVAMFFLVSWIIAMVLLLLMTDIGRPNVVLLSLMVAAFGALVEAESWRGFDNLFVPVGLFLFLSTHLHTEPLALAILAVLFFGTIQLLAAAGPLLGVTRHAARAYTVLVFLICAVTNVQNAVLPMLAVGAHLLAERARPSRSPYPDLDLVAMTTGAALFWLFLGQFMGQNALNVYNLTFAGLALVFAALGAGRHMWLAFLVGAGLVGVELLVAAGNPLPAQWHGMLWPWAVASLALCLVATWRFPALFDRYRSLRAGALALVVPLLLFGLKAAELRSLT